MAAARNPKDPKRKYAGLSEAAAAKWRRQDLAQTAICEGRHLICLWPGGKRGDVRRKKDGAIAAIFLVSGVLAACLRRIVAILIPLYREDRVSSTLTRVSGFRPDALRGTAASIGLRSRGGVPSRGTPAAQPGDPSRSAGGPQPLSVRRLTDHPRRARAGSFFFYIIKNLTSFYGSSCANNGKGVVDQSEAALDAAERQLAQARKDLRSALLLSSDGTSADATRNVTSETIGGSDPLLTEEDGAEGG
eukprot:543133-Prorocentrum_minimum.AAC.2